MKLSVQRFIKNYQGEEATRALLVVQFSLIAMGISLFYFIIHPYFQFHVPRAVFLALPTVLAANFFFLVYGSFGLQQIAQVVIGCFWVSFITGIWYSGGIYSLVLPWLSLMPIMAHLLINHRASSIWLLVSLLSVLFFNFFAKDPSVLEDGSAPWRSTFSLVGLLTVIYFFTHLFHQAKDRMMTAIKNKNEELLEHQEEIQSQNEELMQQRNEIASQRDFIQKQNNLLTAQNHQIELVNKELRQRVREIVTRSEILEKHWHTLLEISKSRSINFGDFGEAMQYLTQRAAESLQTSRVSIWSLNEDRDRIQCLVLYDRSMGRHVIEEELLLKDFPRYFEALRREEVIPADEAQYNPKTLEFKKHYLEPKHIYSMMDTPYFIDGQLGGVLCCEHTDAYRHWTPEDILFAQALSDVVTLAYRANQRREYERRIRQHRKEIVRMNQSLEERVKIRTQELETQNEQLAEYAYINSHLLRGPLSRILGLINLIDYSEKKSQAKEKELIDHLKQSGAELDDIVRKINEAIVDGNTLTRKTLRRSAEDGQA